MGGMNTAREEMSAAGPSLSDAPGHTEAGLTFASWMDAGEACVSFTYIVREALPQAFQGIVCWGREGECETGGLPL